MQDSPPVVEIRKLLHGLLLKPSMALTVAVAFRPVLTSLVVEGVEGLLEGRFDSTTSPENVAVALVNILSFAKHLDRQDSLKGSHHKDLTCLRTLKSLSHWKELYYLSKGTISLMLWLVGMDKGCTLIVSGDCCDFVLFDLTLFVPCRNILQGLNHFVPPIEGLIQMGPSSLTVPALQLAMTSLRLLKLGSQDSRPRMLLGIENLLLNKV